jgi:hypothetical protein
MTFDGPNGHGVKGKPVGCQTFFEKIGLREEEITRLDKSVEALDGHIHSNYEEQHQRFTTVLDKLHELIALFSCAAEHAE